MDKGKIEQILEEWNVCSCDNSALADRLLEEFSPAGEYIKKEDALRIASVATFSVDQVVSAIKALPTYSFPNTDNKGEWVFVVDSYHKDGTPFENHWECSKCGSGRSGWGEFKFCPDCGADMRG